MSKPLTMRILEKLKNIEEKNADSGWITATLTNNFNAYGSTEEQRATNMPQYRRIGKVVEVKGVIAATVEIDANTSATIFTLPERISS